MTYVSSLRYFVEGRGIREPSWGLSWAPWTEGLEGCCCWNLWWRVLEDTRLQECKQGSKFDICWQLSILCPGQNAMKLGVMAGLHCQLGWALTEHPVSCDGWPSLSAWLDFNQLADGQALVWLYLSEHCKVEKGPPWVQVAPSLGLRRTRKKVKS